MHASTSHHILNLSDGCKALMRDVMDNLVSSPPSPGSPREPRGDPLEVSPPLARIRSAHIKQAEADPLSFGDPLARANQHLRDPWESTSTLPAYFQGPMLYREDATLSTQSLTTCVEESSSSRGSRIGLDASPVSWSNSFTENPY